MLEDIPERTFFPPHKAPGQLIAANHHIAGLTMGQTLTSFRDDASVRPR